MSRFHRLLAAAVLLFAFPALSQNDTVTQAREAMSRGEYARAANMLTASLPSQPSADAYLYLGISYAHMRDWTKAEETLKDGAGRYPKDPRFHNELAGVYLAANDLTKTRESLGRALAIDPNDKYASDLLASVSMSMGDIKSALKQWNREGRPVVGDILHNGHVEFENWTVPAAAAFKTGSKLTWNKWRTTELRLQQTGVFSSAGLEIEPTTAPDRYTAVIRTAAKTNSREQLVAPLLEGIFVKTPSFHRWNIRNTAASLSASYRFADDRHRGQLGILAPLPLPGLLFLEATGTFRSERWDISRPAVDNGFDSRFQFASRGVRVDLRHIPNYRVEFDVAYEFRNRTASGSQPGLALDNRNTGKLLFEASVFPSDGRYRSRIHSDGFIARTSLGSQIEFSGGTIEWNNRFYLDKAGISSFEVTAKTGTSRGELPVDEYFILGVRQPLYTETFLRGHNTISHSGHFGSAPMGTSFTLVNTTFDHRMRRLPFFNLLNAPYVDLKWLVFVDGARTFDRAHVFNEGKLLIDTGGGFRLETPTRRFDLIYGQSLRDGTHTLVAYAAKRW